jgi:hypothetical protein
MVYDGFQMVYDGFETVSSLYPFFAMEPPL